TPFPGGGSAAGPGTGLRTGHSNCGAAKEGTARPGHRTKGTVMSPRKFFQLIKQAAVNWNNDNAPTLGAALAYYTVFSLAPLLLWAISIASSSMSEEEARSGIQKQILETLGPTTAEAFIKMLDNAYRTGGGVGVTVVGLVTLLLGASGVFVQLQDS